MTATLLERLEPALELLPVTVEDGQDYATATGPQFQAMTMKPEAFLALNALPDAIATIRSLQAENERLSGALARIRDHDGVSYRFGDEVRQIARDALATPEGEG